MTQRGNLKLPSRIHAYAASFGDDFSRGLICESTEEGSIVLDPFVGAGTTALQAVLLNRDAIGIDVDPIACRISRVLTSRFDTGYLESATRELQEKLNYFKELLSSHTEVVSDLGPGATFEMGSWIFSVPDEPAIAYWFDTSHMATLSIICEVVSQEGNPLVKQAFEVAISSSIIRKWPNTLSNAMDIDHSRPHRPRNPRVQSIEAQFALFSRVLERLKDTILDVQENLKHSEASATILEEDSAHALSTLDSNCVGFILTSPPYFNAIDYPRAHKFSQWWLSPHSTPLGRSKYLGLRSHLSNDSALDFLSALPTLSKPLELFRGMRIYRNVARYVQDLSEVIDQLYRVVRVGGTVVVVVADNVLAGRVFPVSTIVKELMIQSGFSSVSLSQRTIRNTRRRYPFGNNGFTGPMKYEFTISGVRSLL